MAKQPKEPMPMADNSPQLPPPTEEDLARYRDHLQRELAFLYKGRAQEYMEQQSEATRKRFSNRRRELRLLMDAFVQVEFEKLASSLEANDEDLEAAINNLKREREKLEDAAKVIDTIASAIGVIARVVAIAMV